MNPRDTKLTVLTDVAIRRIIRRGHPLARQHLPPRAEAAHDHILGETFHSMAGPVCRLPAT